jgi:hypothetical protein
VAKTSDLRRYADLKGVDVRTVRSWCETKKIPAEKWKRDGRWHLHPLLIAKEESLRYFRRYFGSGNDKVSLSERDKRALEYTLVKTGLRDWEERRQFIFCRYRHHPDAYSETSQPYADIMTAADWLMLEDGFVTVETLAKHLRMSKSKLYDRHPGMMAAIKKRYRDCVDQPVVDLPGGVQAVGAVEFDYAAIDKILDAAKSAQESSVL